MTVATRKESIAKSLTLSFVVDASPMQVFDAVTNVRGWWTSEIKGKSAQVGDVFTYRYEDIHRSTQRLVEVVPGRKVTWYVEDAYLSFTEDKEEWKGTVVAFEITPKGKKTELRFTHEGLVPSFECFDACTGGWDFYINTSLKSLITTGKGVKAAW